MKGTTNYKSIYYFSNHFALYTVFFIFSFLAIPLLFPHLALSQGGIPIIESINPQLGYSDSATLITIHGENFTEDTMISIYGEGPILKGSYDTPGKAFGVYVLGDFAYVADGNSGLQIIDVSNPQSPTLRGTYDTPGYAVRCIF
jgi:hypothetical protein